MIGDLTLLFEHYNCRPSQSKMALIASMFDPFAPDTWDPFEDIPNSAGGSLIITKIDWKETPEVHIFKADLPGLRREDVKVEIDEGRGLRISGERKKEQEEKNDIWHRMERGIGKFFRRFRLPENAKTDQVKANMDNGVLTVTVPKEQEKKPAVRTIEIAG
ncbi:hypothetical protein F0562_031672 [Nyssa sinensis]|uniref:SHSP domain-containing protein n=1 Tax=Nyssa sinensis TaxID=561372 RepID=A0A5J5ASQ9_9ASTE|nr:hypothetical protein F0562_031672 [Nyssa sinensis]